MRDNNVRYSSVYPEISKNLFGANFHTARIPSDVVEECRGTHNIRLAIMGLYTDVVDVYMNAISPIGYLPSGLFTGWSLSLFLASALLIIG